MNAQNFKTRFQPVLGKCRRVNLDICKMEFCTVVAERLSARLLIVQCGQFAFVCMYVCMYVYIYIYPSHFNCMGAVSVVSSPDYEPRSTGLTTRQS